MSKAFWSGVLQNFVATVLLLAVPTVAGIIAAIGRSFGASPFHVLVVIVTISLAFNAFEFPSRFRRYRGRYRSWRLERLRRRMIPRPELPLEITVPTSRFDQTWTAAVAYVKARYPDATPSAINLDLRCEASYLGGRRVQPVLGCSFWFDSEIAKASITARIVEVAPRGAIKFDGEPRARLWVDDEGKMREVTQPPWRSRGDRWLDPLQQCFAHYRPQASKDPNGVPLFNLDATYWADDRWLVLIDKPLFGDPAPKYSYWAGYDGKIEPEREGPPKPPPGLLSGFLTPPPR